MSVEEGSGTEDSCCAHLERGWGGRGAQARGGAPREGDIRVSIPVAVLAVATITVLAIALVALLVGKYNCPGVYEPPVSEGSWPLSCPQEWVSSGRRCYFLSTMRDTWSSAQSSCSTDGAALAGVDSAKDTIFLKRHVGGAPHWIGVKSQAGRPRKGREVSHRVNGTDPEGCAFLNSTGVGHADCGARLPWVCSKGIR